MVRGRMENEWSHTAQLMALIANCVPRKNGKIFHPRDFNPMVKQQPKPKANPAVIISLLFGRHDLAQQGDHGSN